MKNNYLIITALQRELNYSLIQAGIPIIYTGIGKVNACINTLKAIHEFQPQLIINFGTVGKINAQLNGIIEIHKVIQRDMLTEPLAPRGEVPFNTLPNFHTSPFGNHICATGDSFVTTADPWLIEQGVDVVDMELFAIAAAAHQHNTPWRSFKFITDSANEDSKRDWNNSVHEGEQLFLDQLSKLL
jgi:adenosylhomocysteine nucleosidase